MLPGSRLGSPRCASKDGLCNVIDVQCGDAACAVGLIGASLPELKRKTDVWERDVEGYSPVPNVLVPLEHEPYPEREEHGQGINRVDSSVVVVVCGREEESVDGIPDSRQNRIHFFGSCSVARRAVTRFNQRGLHVERRPRAVGAWQRAHNTHRKHGMHTQYNKLVVHGRILRISTRFLRDTGFATKSIRSCTRQQDKKYKKQPSKPPNMDNRENHKGMIIINRPD
jgi:hypothetical protein